MNSQNGKLARVLGFWGLAAYGTGDILGAGIYALIGEIAGIAGAASWVSFGVALGVASLTALAYAELGSRFPRSGGESFFCHEAFGREWLSLLVGWLVLASGVVSLATVSRAFARYLQELLPAFEVWHLVPVFLLLLTAINFWGMRQSSLANIFCTLVEVAGLLFVIGVALWALGSGERAVEPADAVEANGTDWVAVFQGGALAFFAFIGFEDMINVAEEVKRPEKTLPAAIATALCVAGVIYVVVAFVAVRIVPPQELAGAPGPLVEVVRRAAPALPAGWFTPVALFAVANTGLLNFIMGSRLIYGMADQGLLPSWFARVHATRQTPWAGIVTVLALAMTLALSGDLAFLAGTTSCVILAVFLSVNVSLLVIRWRRGAAADTFRVPLAVPLVAAVACLGLLSFVPPRSLLWAGIIVAIGVVFVTVNGFRRSRR